MKRSAVYGRFDRRTVLKLLGASTVGASLPWLRSRDASAQADEVPLRILFIEAGAGVRRGTFEPSERGALYVTRNTVVTDWTFREVMSPLAPYRAKATMFDNLDMISVKRDPSSPANAHIDGLTHMLTAADRYQGSGDLGNGPSIDQLIAQRLNAQGPITKLPSLEVMVTDDAGPYARSRLHDAYSAPGQKVPFLTYVPDVWDRIFPEPLTAADDPEAGRLRARKTSIYDFVKGDYNRLIDRLGTEDRVKVQQMLDYRTELRSRVSVVTNREGNRPSQDSILDPWSVLREGYEQGNSNNRTWKTHADLIGKMVAAAFHTDTTRVANLSIEGPPYYEFGYTSGSFGTTDAHDLDHKASGDEPSLTDPAAAAVLDQSRRVMYEQIRVLLDELASLQETDGKSLLDHTLVVVYSHIAEGSHDVTRLPWLVIGDAHGYLKTGQYIRFPVVKTDTTEVVTDPKVSRVWSSRGRAHNDLFVTIAGAMGIAITEFGRTGMPESGGVITEMLA